MLLVEQQIKSHSHMECRKVIVRGVDEGVKSKVVR